MNQLEQKLDDAVNRAVLSEVEALVEKGANIEYRDPFGCSALMNAAWVAADDIVQFLLGKGADPTVRNNDGQTALDMVRSIGHNDYGHDAVIKILEDTASS